MTTSAGRAGRVLAGRRPGRPLVVFSTYHSAPVAAAAATAADVVFDLVIADEAHRLAGYPRAEFRTVVEDSLPATVRVFLTATAVVTAPAQTAEGWDDWTAPRASSPMMSRGGSPARCPEGAA